MRPGWGNAEWVDPVLQSNLAAASHAFPSHSHWHRFFWIDAGISHFFTGGQPEKPFARLQATDLEPDRFYATRGDLSESGSLNADRTIGSHSSLIRGGVFGGYAAPVKRVSAELLRFLHREMLDKGRMDNEQVALGLICVAHRDWFRLLDQNARGCDFVCL